MKNEVGPKNDYLKLSMDWIVKFGGLPEVAQKTYMHIMHITENENRICTLATLREPCSHNKENPLSTEMLRDCIDELLFQKLIGIENDELKIVSM